jgi:DNA-binding NtrC family response regulator
MDKPKILLVDDEKIIVTSLQRDLELEDFEVTACLNSIDALRQLEMGHFDVVVTDLVMEDLNGLDVLAEARRLDPEVAVIILTGHGDMDSAIKALRLGADDYLLKPCDFEELLIRINRSRERHEMRHKIVLYERILPICCVCKKIRDDEGVGQGEGKWMSADKYITRKTDVLLSHGLCPDCADKIE